ncbi:STAS domain-containing protein [Kitasatospora sp. MBT66]|uniref:STAS domain-containing protein n=1 Tax=Kitasatospora sp. MBT66 TaxID=1444769 RepID=UPI0005BE989F|nr:STAS domain-containing protein [Kitasatospora sp. MBT66]
MPEHDHDFAVTVRESLAGPVLECSGELDLDQVPVLHAALHRALAVRPAPPMLLVDLGGVTFMDSTGLNALLLARIEAARAGTTVHLARPSHIVARLLEITGTDQVFPIDPDVPAARSAR